MNTSLQPHISQTVSPQPGIHWLTLMFGNLPQAILLVDNEGMVQLVNESFCKLFNISVPQKELVGTSANDLWNNISKSAADARTFIAEVNLVAGSNETIQDRQLFLQPDKILSIDFTPLKQDEKIVACLWQFKDETERYKAEQSLKQQRKFYEDVLDSIPSDIAVFSPEHRYLYINPIGLKDPELRKWLIGKDDFEYCEKRGKDIALAENRRNIFNEITSSGKEKEWEESIINKNGETEHHLRRLRPIFNDQNELLWIIGYGVNITDRKIFEKQIQLSEKRYRDLFNYSQAIICTHDMKGNFLSANPALLEVMGYEEIEIIGKNIKEFLIEDDRQAFDDLYLPSIQKDNKTKGIFKVIHKNGSKVYLLYQNYRVEESSQGEAYIIAFAQDITDRVKAEKELKIAKLITEETARNKEKFLANMSHEIRTPMNGIIGITSFLQKTQLNEEQKNYLNIVQESANDLLTIINDILDLEKVGTGQIQFENIPFDIVAKTQTIIKLFEITARNKGVDISFENKIGSGLTIKGDPTRFNQVLNNLISNAVKFTSKGLIKVEAHKQDETAKEVTLQFSVSDTGIGIDRNNLEKIFNPFTQAYPETTRMYGGTGLGLAITKNLVELQGGSIWVNSEPKKGSTFSFSISFQKCSDGEQTHVQASARVENTLGELKILVAEDNEVNQLLTTGMLSQMGFSATSARNGKEVLELLSKDAFDIILMDIQMPEMNGYEATQAIRSLPGVKRHTPIIALTANALKSEEENYNAAGMNGFLTKPFTESALYDLINQVLKVKQDFIHQNKEPMSQNSAEKLYDLAMVSELARGNQEFILNLAKIFIDTVPPTAKEMVEACEQKKWEQMGKLAHKLKSTIDTLNIASLKDDIRAIEKNGKEQKNLDITPAMVENADVVIRQVTEQLKSEFNL
jgi:PAS domain S-box-containing protein